MLLSMMNCDGGSIILPRMSMKSETTDLGRLRRGRGREYGPSLKLTVEMVSYIQILRAGYELPDVPPAIFE